jgi:hypothetical protein
MNTSKKGTKKEKKDKRKWLIIAAVLLFIIVTIILLLRQQIADLIFDSGNRPEPVGIHQTSESITISGATEYPMQEGDTILRVKFENYESNPCYLRVTLILAEDNSVLYQSNYLEPGNGLYEISLSRSYGVGEYPISVKYEHISIADRTPMNGGNFPSKLVVSGRE